jgi:hypothetical protein
MSISPLAGKPAEPSILVDVSRLVTAYYTGSPDPSVPSQRVAFGTSGHRGSSSENAFNEAHILAITQAIYLNRRGQKIDGPSTSASIHTHSRRRPSPAPWKRRNSVVGTHSPSSTPPRRPNAILIHLSLLVLRSTAIADNCAMRIFQRAARGEA